MVRCHTCGVITELMPQGMNQGLPYGWTVEWGDDYIDQFYCNLHSVKTKETS